MTDAIDAREDTGSERLCVATRQRHDPAELIRFVAGPDGAITPDVAAKLPGRGAWVKADRALVELALGKGKLARALELSQPARPTLEAIEALLLKRCQELLSIGRRSGMVIGGGGKIRAAGMASGLIIATDASGREARALAGDVDHDWRMEHLSGEELGAAFGRASLAFAAVLARDSHHADRIASELRRLEMFRSGGGE